MLQKNFDTQLIPSLQPLVDESAADAADRAEVRAWLSAHASLRRGEDDGSNGPSDHPAAAEREFFDRCRAWQQTRFDYGWSDQLLRGSRVVFIF